MNPDRQTWPTLFERLPRVALVCVLAAFPILGSGAGLGFALGCAPAPDQVELRLYPCELDGMQPRSVVVEITGFDAAGEIVEEYEVGFDNIDAAVFDDGYATVGYRSDLEVVTATIRLGWFSGPSAGSFAEAESVAELPMLSVPAHGEVLELGDGSGDCSEVAGDGDGDATDTNPTQGDGDGDTSGDGDGDTSDSDTNPTEGDGDGDTTTNSGDGDGDSGDGDGDTTTTDSGDGDGDTTTTDSGDGDGDTTSGDGDGDPPAGPMPAPGEDCDMPGNLYCGALPEGQAGEPLQCAGGTLVPYGNQVGACDNGQCGDDTPVDACAGFGAPSYCLCLPPDPEPCEGAQLGCSGDSVRLCFEGQVVEGFCPNCFDNGGLYQCT